MKREQSINKEVLRNNLILYMKIREITQSVLAKKSGLTYVTVHRYLTGERTPKSKNIERMAEVLEIPVKALLSGDSYTATLLEKEILTLTEKLSPLLTSEKKQAVINRFKKVLF